MSQPPDGYRDEGVPAPPNYDAAPGFHGYAVAGEPPQPGGPAAYPPYGYGYGYGYSNPAEAKNILNVLSLVLSLSGLVFGVTAVAGIVLGHLGLDAARRGEATNRSLGVAGLWVGYSLVGLGALVTIGYIAFIGLVLASTV